MRLGFISKLKKLHTMYGDYMSDHLTPADVEYMAKTLIKLNKQSAEEEMQCKAMLSSWVNKPKRCTYYAKKAGLCKRHYNAKTKILTTTP